MKKTIFLPLVAIIVLTAVLFALNICTKGIEEKNAAVQLDRVMKALVPGSTSFIKESPEENDTVTAAYKGETGYVVETATRGYADEIIMLVGVSNDGKVTGLVVREMHETPGLGGNALFDYKFLAQYLNTGGDADVNAISGATVTTKAITRSVNAAVGYVTGTDTDSGATVWEG